MSPLAFNNFFSKQNSHHLVKLLMYHNLNKILQCQYHVALGFLCTCSSVIDKYIRARMMACAICVFIADSQLKLYAVCLPHEGIVNETGRCLMRSTSVPPLDLFWPLDLHGYSVRLHRGSSQWPAEVLGNWKQPDLRSHQHLPFFVI